MNSRITRIGVVCVALCGPAMCAMAVTNGPAAGPGREATMPLDMLAAGMVNAKEHGAVGNGQADDTQALQGALNTAEKRGPVCYLPAGQYRINGSLVVPAGVTLCGASGGVPHSEHPIGTVLLAYGGSARG